MAGRPNHALYQGGIVPPAKPEEGYYLNLPSWFPRPASNQFSSAISDLVRDALLILGTIRIANLTDQPGPTK